MWTRTPAWALVALCGAGHVALTVGARWDRRLAVAPVDGQIVFGQATAAFDVGATQAGPRVWQRIDKLGTLRLAQYGFIDFKQDRIGLAYKIPESDFQRYNAAYGYRPEEVAALQKWRDGALARSYRAAVAAHANQQQVDAQATDIQNAYVKKLRAYLEARGFVLENGNVTRIDMPAVVKRNGPWVKPVAQVFDRFATAHGYDSMDIIGAVLSFAQTAIKYKEPDAVYKGKHTGGLLPPVTTLVLGWGDCDTKTGLVASILSNWSQMRMVGIAVPDHYLMAVLQIPDKGEMFVEYDGLQYVLLEPAGPAWIPPGSVGTDTVALLNGSDSYKIDPFF